MSDEPDEQQRAGGDPVNPARMWIGFGLLAISVVIVVVGYSGEDAAETIGAGFAPLVIGLAGDIDENAASRHVGKKYGTFAAMTIGRE